MQTKPPYFLHGKKLFKESFIWELSIPHKKMIILIRLIFVNITAHMPFLGSQESSLPSKDVHQIIWLEDNRQCGQSSERTIVSADNCQCGQLSERTIVRGTFVREDICPRQFLLKPIVFGIVGNVLTSRF